MMDALSQERLEKLSQMDVAALTQDDCAFLRARSSYLTDDERAKFADVLKGDVDGNEVKDSEPAVKLDRNKLIKKAKEMKLAVEKTMKAEQIKALIDNAEFEAAEQKEREEAARLEEEARAKSESEEAAKKAEEEAEAAKVGPKGNFSKEQQEGAEQVGEQ